MSRRRRPHLRRQKRFMEFLWPFLLIILGGIILILVVQFVWALIDQKETELKNKINFDLTEGGAEILPWGQAEWTKAYDDQLVLEGDMLAMERESRGTLEFYNGTHVRMDEVTKVNIEEIETGSDLDEIEMSLRTGSVWLNVEDSSDDALRMVVLTDNLRVTSYGTIFEVAITDREIVRVMEGEVLVEVLEQNSDREVVLEQIKVGVGQEIEVTSADMATMMARQPVSLLAALSDDWKETHWYEWNVSEDEQMLAVVVEEDDSNSAETIGTFDVVETEEEIVEEEVEEAEEEVEVDLTPPTVAVTIPVASPYILTEEDSLPYSLHGTVSENAVKVTVTSYDAAGSGFSYELQHYQAGDLSWRYGLAADYGNLREGRNMFTVVAENGSGVESESLQVIVEVPEGFLDVEEEETTEIDESTDEAEAETEEEVVAEEETVEETVSDAPLTAPAVTSLNGDFLDGTYSTSAVSVLVLGTVSTSAASVYVNDFQLTKFVAGSGEWSYYCEDQHLNYDVGTNTYVVYAEDVDGNVSDSFTFEIYRVAP
ncbi:hypothetical protein HN748_03380 [Candidatus Peregrinibacteria bacterium]|jgi:hypothetical protein|nr:hypothetical protein [Candidatus Peregrinibacteria bacterium]MBT7484241.1 hypothetical protein [Candidatus Peregrinibacteria bacterium]MBT7703250.1 hypothetical protein [Candidatus Peregrinibacteria bacterium]